MDARFEVAAYSSVGKEGKGHGNTMGTIGKSDHTIGIRRARPDDLPFLRSLALEVFSIYGDYETILTDYFLSDGVYTYVAEKVRKGMAIPVGILMLAIRKLRRQENHIAEIVAIAVERGSQRYGIGSRLIDFAKQWPLSLSKKIPITEIHLSVAETNLSGRSFFLRQGFEKMQDEPWRYPAGQKAFRMRYSLRDRSQVMG